MAGDQSVVASGGDEITPASNPTSSPRKELRDKATEFLASHGAGDTSFTHEEERHVLRRIDLRILPLILGAYFFQQLDKSSLRFVPPFLISCFLPPPFPLGWIDSRAMMI